MGVREIPLAVAAARLAELADEVISTREPVMLTRPEQDSLVLISAARLESLEETMFWLRDGLERAALGEPFGDGEEGPGLTEGEARTMFAHLLTPPEKG